MNLLSRFANKTKRPIIIVSGLPRSGTSMMMKMLEAGGLESVTDSIRSADEDNPEGYYEFERVKRLPDHDTEWLSEAEGKAVKVISQLLLSLPDSHTYKVLFMHRNMAEILASQRKMLQRRGEKPDKVADEEMARLFTIHLNQVYAWMEEHSNVSYIDIDYNQTIQEPWPAIQRIKSFLGIDLNIEKMAAVVDPSLYRQRF